MPRLADLHYHAIFGVDDGSRSIEMTEQMLAISYAEGVRVLCLTPHGDPIRFPCEREVILSRFEEIKQLCRERFPEMTLYLGNEVFAYVDSAAAVAAGDFSLMGDGRVVLVEFAPDMIYRDMCNILQSYRAVGFHPMLAHAERYSCLLKNVDRVYELAQMRVLIQINASSLRRSVFPSAVNRFAYRLLNEGLIDVVASDAHAVEVRTPRLLDAYAAVEKRCGSAQAQKLFYDNPVRILTGEKGGIAYE
jgi:protein-tyrosine phosphatase